MTRGEKMLKFCTANGSTIEIRPNGINVDMHLRDASGRTVATVVMSKYDAWSLVCDLEDARS